MFEYTLTGVQIALNLVSSGVKPILRHFLIS